MFLTKSDFLLYLDAPIHLWASKHDRLTKKPPSDYDQHLMKQGYEVESLAHTFLEQTIVDETHQLLWQQTYLDGHFQVRTDAMVFDKPAQKYDLYEIKSRSEFDDLNVYDLTFQTIVVEANLPNLRHQFAITLNKDYVRHGELDLTALFKVEQVDEQVDDKRVEVLAMRQDAWATCELESAKSLEPCVKPKNCPCLELCHPNLPDHSIYHIPRIKKATVLALRAQHVFSIHDVPEDLPLSAKQRRHVEAAQSGETTIDHERVSNELASYQFPLSFFDYETYNAAIPPHDGYRPYQQMVFQYSLHIIGADGAVTHSEFVADDEGDSGRMTVEHLQTQLGGTGTVLVWNKTFEMGRNSEMAKRYPDLAAFLLSLNDRIRDLADIFSKDMYVHPGFKGSWSIKNVLPVIVPVLSYKELEIGKGDQAMSAWWNMRHDKMSELEKETVKQNLLKYCGLDTWAMVEIWKEMKKL